MISPSTKRIIIYTGQAAIAAALGGLTLPMLGDGTIGWAEFRFRWVMFLLSMTASCLNVLRAFYDQTVDKEPGHPAQPDTGAKPSPNDPDAPVAKVEVVNTADKPVPTTEEAK